AGQEASLVEATYARLPAVSIDHGIMEKVSTVTVVPASFEWSDLGSWTSAWELAPRDDHGNALPPGGIALNASANYVQAPDGKLVVLVGVDGLVVVDSGDALLVIPKDRAQDVREVVAALRKRDDPRS
ncbi:MAG: mannose-6-phosphate isomerase, partial [Myxococcales bacterium]|nr:mannose-6-phosphate isomerase [Myxococcales bacterium]